MRWICALSFLLGSICLFAQHPLEGTWIGTMVDSSGEYQMELVLDLEGNVLQGKSTVVRRDHQLVEMRVSGNYYFDRSLNLYDKKTETEFSKNPDDALPKHYQLLFTRSAFGSTLEGFWQEYLIKGNVKMTRMEKINLRKKKDLDKA